MDAQVLLCQILMQVASEVIEKLPFYHDPRDHYCHTARDRNYRVPSTYKDDAPTPNWAKTTCGLCWGRCHKALRFYEANHPTFIIGLPKEGIVETKFEHNNCSRGTGWPLGDPDLAEHIVEWYMKLANLAYGRAVASTEKRLAKLKALQAKLTPPA